MHDIIDNRDEKLIDHIKLLLEGSERARFAVGYFFLSGFEPIRKETAELRELKLLIGSTTTRETIEQLAEGYKRLELVQEAVDQQRFLNRAQQQDAKERTALDLRRYFELMEQTNENEDVIITLAHLIEKKIIKVKVYARGRLHSKAYVFDYPDDGRYEKGIAIIGSSNLTLAGIAHPTELNVVVQGNDNHARLVQWFDELWEKEALEFDEELMRELKMSWAANPVMPYDIYVKTLYMLVKDRLEAEEVSPIWEGEVPLADFQRDGVKQAARILDKYGGVFIADVAGFGKTFIGGALLQHLNQLHGWRPLIICPASLTENMWEPFCEKYNINARVLSMGMLRFDGVQLEGNELFENRDLVLIDESHNFRHPNTQRYQVLQPFLLGRPVILVTATPLNTSVWDIYHQMKLFHPVDRTALPIEPPDLRAYIKGVEEGRRRLPDLLRHVLIRRPRKFVEKYYPNSTINGKPLRFPKRKLEAEFYSIENSYPGVYDAVYDLLKQFQFAKYGLWHYVLPAKQYISPYSELQQAGQNLRGLMRILLFKRFESSVEAFRLTLERLRRTHVNFLTALDAGYIPAGEEAEELLFETGWDEESDVSDFLEQIAKASKRYHSNDFDVARLWTAVENDCNCLKQMYDLVKGIKPESDDKLKTLSRLLRRKPLNTEKVLIFSQYAETVDYLYRNLKGVVLPQELERVYSQSDNLASAIKRFAPKANPYLTGRSEPSIRVLIGTDVLSEGHNLQDCSIVINYDLHWNPIRLIQRVGRVDRVTTEAEDILTYNFFPERELERQLGLREKLQHRIQEIHDFIGEDAPILEQTERLNKQAMYAIYEGREDILDIEEEADIVTEAEAFIRQLGQNHPEYFNYIKNLPDGVRSARGGALTKGLFVFCQAGAYQKLYLTDPEGNVLSTDLTEVLRAIECSFSEQRLELPREHNRVVSKVLQHFREEAQQRQAELESPRHTRAQRYILKELRLLHQETKDEEEKERVAFLQRVLSVPLPPAVNQDLNRLRHHSLKGKELMQRLLDVYRRHALGTWLDQATTRADGPEVPHIVCSEALL
jgi:hypothetical protein